MSLINFARRILAQAPRLPISATSSYVHRTNSLQFRHASTSNEDVNKILMEFFDDKKNWGENEVKHGRGWELPELRIKSNEDLHKLWFVLLKEKNMLLTMEHEGVHQHRLFASPERIDKVQESMENLETVVRERNRAYYELETGETGERPGRKVSGQLGIAHFYRSCEHVIPYFFNKKWRMEHVFHYKGTAVRKFLQKYREKLWNAKRKVLNRDRNEVVHLMKRFPHLDKKTVQAKYPNVNIDRLEKRDMFRGHQVPKI